MQEQYIVPELKLVGEANEVVLGSMHVGTDFDAMRMPPGGEFETDEQPCDHTGAR